MIGNLNNILTLLKQKGFDPFRVTSVVVRTLLPWNDIVCIFAVCN